MEASTAARLETCVRSGSIDAVDAVFREISLEERASSVVHCMLYAIRDDNIGILKHLMIKYKRIRKLEQKSQSCDSGTSSQTTEVPSVVNVPTGIPGRYRKRDMSPERISLSGIEPMKRDETPENNTTNNNRDTSMDLEDGNDAGDGAAAAADGKDDEDGDEDEEFEDVQFAPDVTPLVLAAQLERRQMIELLLKEWSQDIHPMTLKGCTKENCFACEHVIHGTDTIDGWPVETCCQSLEWLRAMSSPAYILATSPEDPILEAFGLSNLATERQRIDSAFCETYQEISLRCRRFTLDFVNLCRTSEEVKILLSHKDGMELTNARKRKITKARFPRLQLAVHYSQKEFVGHGKCQQVLKQTWNGGMPNWARRPKPKLQYRLLYFIFSMFVLLPSVFLYIFPIFCCFEDYKCRRFIKEPIVKFVNDAAMYLVFIILLCISVLHKATAELGQIAPVEWIIFLWIIGFTVRFCKVVFVRCADMWSVWMISERHWPGHELLLILAFLGSFVLRLIVMAGLTASEEDKFKKRGDLQPNDLILISEILYGIGCVFALPQIFVFCKASAALGPLQLSLKRTIVVIARFMIIFVLILMSFVLGLTYIYVGYATVEVTTNNTTANFTGNDHFTTIDGSVKSLFWSIFGYSELEDFDIPIKGDTRPIYTEIAGYSIICIYHITIIIILVNMFIAMVSNAYNAIEANADLEWKFVRTQLRMSYSNIYGCLPPPFNLLAPIRKFIKPARKAISRLRGCACSKERTISQEEINKRQRKDYIELMERLAKRYWKQREILQRVDVNKDGSQQICMNLLNRDQVDR